MTIDAVISLAQIVAWVVALLTFSFKIGRLCQVIDQLTREMQALSAKMGSHIEDDYKRFLEVYSRLARLEK